MGRIPPDTSRNRAWDSQTTTGDIQVLTDDSSGEAAQAEAHREPTYRQGLN